MARKLLLLILLVLVLPVLISCNGGDGTIEKIQRDKIAYIGTVPFEPPLMYQVGADYVGPDAELGHRIVAKIQELRQGATESEIKATWINRPYPTMIQAVANAEVGFAIGNLAITESRKKEVGFSDPYYTSELVLIVNPVQNDLATSAIGGAKIGVREGTGVEEFVKGKYSTATAVPYKTLDDAVLGLRRGEVDGVIDDRLMAGYSLATTPGATHMEIIPEVLGKLEVAVVVKKNDKQLLNLVNEVIAQAKKEGMFESWTQEHAGTRYEEVVKRRVDRLEAEEKAAEPRQISIRVAKDANFQMDIYKMANLQWVFRERTSGQSFSSSRIDFQGRVGVASASIPPGDYVLSLPKFNFSTSVQINPTDPKSIPIRIQLTSGGVVVRKG